MINQEYWFAAKVKAHTEKKIKEYLVAKGIKHYIPFHSVVIERGGRRIRKEKPVIPSLIFVYATKDTALHLPQESHFTINYMRNLETKQLLVVPEKQMQDFMFVLDLSESAIPIPNEQLRKGLRVRVVKGEFAGIEGELIRVKGHKRVVIRLEGIFSLATTYIPREHIEVLD